MIYVFKNIHQEWVKDFLIFFPYAPLRFSIHGFMATATVPSRLKNTIAQISK